MSDIHGQYDLFIRMLEEINFSDKDELWVIGDVIDRGSDSIKILSYIMTQNNIHMTLGNHEEFMIDFFKRNRIPKNMGEIYEMSFSESWLRNGGIDTLKELKNRSTKQPLFDILDYLKNLPLFKILNIDGNTFILVHANIWNSKYGIETSQSRDFMLWDRRTPSDKDRIDDSMFIITGHTPTNNFHDSNKVFRSHNWFLIDCGSCYTGVLGCLRLDDLKEFYVER